MIPWEDRHRWLGKVVFRRVSGSGSGSGSGDGDGDGDGDGGVVVLNEQCKKERGLGTSEECFRCRIRLSLFGDELGNWSLLVLGLAAR